MSHQFVTYCGFEDFTCDVRLTGRQFSHLYLAPFLYVSVTFFYDFFKIPAKQKNLISDYYWECHTMDGTKKGFLRGTFCKNPWGLTMGRQTLQRVIHRFKAYSLDEKES